MKSLFESEYVMTRFDWSSMVLASCITLCQIAAGNGADLVQARLETPHEKGDGWTSADYDSGMDFYRAMAEANPMVRLEAAGPSDSGPPLHLVLVSLDQDFEPASVREKGRAILLVNNAIHPGETDGVDASMAFVRDMVADVDQHRACLENVMIAVIPYYNIGGALNRNSVTRVNQNGPREYGFRGNARNYDLNRDFIKCDTLNARSFAEIFRRLDPDLLVDTHVSNGADYQYVMTTAHSQKDKLGFGLGTYLDSRFEPMLFNRMKNHGYPTVPYVNSSGQPPDAGFPQFLDTPRYSTGYAALFQTIGFMTETHMLKPYPQRVAATRAFLQQSLELLSDQKDTIHKLRLADRANYPRQKQVAIAWQLDSDTRSKLEFHGYESSRVSSNVTSGDRLLYDRSKPYVKQIEYFNAYKPSCTVALPAAYLIPRGWHKVIDLMKLHGVEMKVIQDVTPVEAEVYQLETITTSTNPYEGHYFHDVVKVSIKSETIAAQPGDVLIPIDQGKARYIVETLEPQATDSLFRWNFFDTVLQQKESFSPYVFEDTAGQLLQSNENLKTRFEQRLKDDPDFASNPPEQLKSLYRQSDHYESAHRRYPIARLKEIPHE